MALGNPFKNAFSVMSSKFAAAGAKFRTYKEAITDYLTPFLLWREFNRFRESRQFQRVAGITRKVPPMRKIPAYLHVETDRLLKAKYQYFFNMNLSLTTGESLVDHPYSVLSDIELTHEQAIEEMKSHLSALLAQSALIVDEWGESKLISLIERKI